MRENNGHEILHFFSTHDRLPHTQHKDQSYSIGTCCAGPLQWGQSVDVIMYCKNIAGLNLQRTHRETITVQYMSTQYGFRKETVQNAKHLQGI